MIDTKKAHKRNTWISYATGFSTAPTLLGTTTAPANGDVWQYDYGLDTKYRFISDDGTMDYFYDSYAGSVLSGLIVKKELEL